MAQLLATPKTWFLLATFSLLVLIVSNLDSSAVQASGIISPGGESLAPVGPDRCGECHAEEHAAWLTTVHQKSFKGMHRTDAAKTIAKNLGMRSIKRADRCMSCHYTAMPKRGKLKASFGVSCESCHGPAEKWIGIHDDFGGKDVTVKTESAAHRKTRIEACTKAGMRHPDDLFSISRRCFECHVLTDPELVDLGGHPGTEAFELLTWSQGEVRHTFADKDRNVEAPLAHRRKMLVLGRMLDAEFALRALAKAPASGRFRTGAAAHLERAKKGLLEIAAKIVGIIEVDTAAKRMAGIHTDISSADAEIAAQAISSEARKFGVRTEASALSAIDALLPKPTDYRGRPHGDAKR